MAGGGSKTIEFKNKARTLVAKGYKRVVVGDYGAYIEFAPEHIVHHNIKNKWPGKPSRPVKYIWMVTCDNEQTKVYFQQGTVGYADYKIGMYYITPEDLNY